MQCSAPCYYHRCCLQTRLARKNRIPGLRPTLSEWLTLASQCVFAHITLAMELFALAPRWCRQVKAFSADLYYQCAWLLFLLTVCGLMPTSRLIAAAYIGTVFLVTLGCPLWLISLQRFKYTINGPWGTRRHLLNVASPKKINLEN